MNNTLPFPPPQADDSDRDNYKWHAYMSSALTLDDAGERDRMLNLNWEIKGWLQQETQTFVYLPQDYSAPGHQDKMPSHEVYILDRWRIAESDFVIMNFDIASFGVGQEAEISCSMGIPVIAFHYKGKRVSRMIRGLPMLYLSEVSGTPDYEIIKYEDQQNHQDLKQKLVTQVRKLQRSISPLETNVIPIQSFSKRLKTAIEKSGKSVEEVSKETGFTKDFLNILQQEYNSIIAMFQEYETMRSFRWRKIPQERFSNPGLYVLQKLSRALNLRVGQLIGEEDINRIWHEPLKKASQNGVSLEEFVNVAEAADYMILYQKAARAETDESATESIANNIIQLVTKKRDGSS
jgi:hypothetical protein